METLVTMVIVMVMVMTYRHIYIYIYIYMLYTSAKDVQLRFIRTFDKHIHI
jgi:hypothetical protein